LLLFDALGMKFRELKLRKNPNCPMCGTHRTITKLIDYYEFCGVRGEEAPGPSVQCRRLRRVSLRRGWITETICLSWMCASGTNTDLQSQGAPHSARRADRGACMSWILRAKSWRIAGAESAPRKPWIFLRKAGFRKFSISRRISRGPTKVDPSVPKLLICFQGFVLLEREAIHPGRGVCRFRLLQRKSIGILCVTQEKKMATTKNHGQAQRVHPRGG